MTDPKPDTTSPHDWSDFMAGATPSDLAGGYWHPNRCPKPTTSGQPDRERPATPDYRRQVLDIIPHLMRQHRRMQLTMTPNGSSAPPDDSHGSGMVAAGIVGATVAFVVGAALVVIHWLIDLDIGWPGLVLISAPIAYIVGSRLGVQAHQRNHFNKVISSTMQPREVTARRRSRLWPLGRQQRQPGTGRRPHPTTATTAKSSSMEPTSAWQHPTTSAECPASTPTDVAP